jgi:hypothetical protein
VYAASEGLDVIAVERQAAGGQAGQSSVGQWRRPLASMRKWSCRSKRFRSLEMILFG